VCTMANLKKSVESVQESEYSLSSLSFVDFKYWKTPKKHGHFGGTIAPNRIINLHPFENCWRNRNHCPEATAASC
jgi:hypothetical protein